MFGMPFQEVAQEVLAELVFGPAFPALAGTILRNPGEEASGDLVTLLDRENLALKRRSWQNRVIAHVSIQPCV